MTAPVCPLDGKPIHDQAAICTACSADLIQNLAELPALLDDLDLTLSRQTAQGQRHGGRSSEKALPYDTRASDTLTAARVVLVGWVNVLRVSPWLDECLEHSEGWREAGDNDDCDCRYILGDKWPADTPQAMAGWLYDRHERARRHEAGADLATEVRDLAHAARRAVDSPAERWYAGPCGADLPSSAHSGFGNVSCGEELYARPDAAETTCRACGTRYDVPERRTWLLQAAEDRLLPGPDIARALTRLGAEVTPARIRQWKHRSRLIPHAEDTRNGRPVDLYRVGDVLDLLAREAARKAVA